MAGVHNGTSTEPLRFIIYIFINLPCTNMPTYDSKIQIIFQNQIKHGIKLHFTESILKPTANMQMLARVQTYPADYCSANIERLCNMWCVITKAI